MDVPKKIRLLRTLQKIFPVWSLTLQAKVIERAFDDDLAQAKKKGDSEKYGALSSQQDFEASEYWGQIRSLRSRRLVMRAERMFVPTTDLKWDRNGHGSRYLESESEKKLYNLVREEQRKIWDLRVKVILAIAGLASILTSLVLALKK